MCVCVCVCVFVFVCVCVCVCVCVIYCHIYIDIYFIYILRLLTSFFRPAFGFTSQYIVNIDDFILHYIQKEAIPVEFHQAVGTEYRTIAVGRLRMNELLEKGSGRVYGTLKLLG